MLAATAILTAYSFVMGKDHLSNVYRFEKRWVIIGIVAAAFIYLVFFMGNYFSRLLFDFAGRQVENIYATKDQGSKIFIGLALFFWIGPAEEIFWRGFVQNHLSLKYGDNKGFWIATAAYSLVHIWAFNFMLFMAALICGLFWGWLFKKYKSVWPGIISHALWDAVIFVIWPL